MRDVRDTVAKLFKSRKFVTMLCTIVSYLAAVFGVDVSPEKLYPILVLVGLYIGGQSYVDAQTVGGSTAATKPPSDRGGTP